MKTTKNVRVAILALALCEACWASEKIVTAGGTDFSHVQKMLDDGWTVKASHAVVAETTAYGNHRIENLLHVFTLASPPAETLAALERKRAAEAKAVFERKRAESRDRR
jgi:hypothetical protein